jgi:phosphate transport system substrate-binding protein
MISMPEKNSGSCNILNKNAITTCIIAIFFLASASPGCLSSDMGSNDLLQTEEKTLTISGSTTIQPVSEILAAAYMKENPGVDIVVTGGGSSRGITDAGTGAVDIGASSREVKESELMLYPDLEVKRIGASAIVIITSQNNDMDTITFEEASALYNDRSEDISLMPGIASISTVVQRSEESGTEETFASWLFPEKKNVDSSLETEDYGINGRVVQLAAEGNAEVLNLVKENPFSIGFVDFGYAESDPGIKILRIVDKGADEAVPSDIAKIREALLLELRTEEQDNRGETFYIPGLTRPLNYITNWELSSLTNDFIDFAVSPSSKAYFNEVGYFSVAELNQEV